MDDIIEKTLVMVEDSVHVSDKEKTNESGIRLFKHAPPGIVFDYMGKWTSSNIDWVDQSAPSDHFLMYLHTATR